MKKVLFCTPYEGISNSNIGGISVWAKAIVEHYECVNSDVELVVHPLDRKTYVRGVNAVVRLWSGVVEYLSLVRNVKRHLQSESFDAIHLCTTASLGLLKDWMILRYAKSKGIKTFLHFHCGRIPEIMQRKNWETWLLRRVLAMTDAPIVMDEKSFHVLEECSVGGVKYIPNPLSSFVDKMVERLKNDMERVENRLLFVGHVVDIKGVYELVRACSTMSEVELRMVGHVEDAVRDRLLEIASNRSGEWLHFTGGLSREETIGEILSAEVLVAPSYIEGFPNVILEAMACGTPIVASRVGAIPEMLAHGKCGVLIEPRSVESICSGIGEMLSDDDKRGTFAQLAKQRVKQCYSIASVWNQLTEVWLGM